MNKVFLILLVAVSFSGCMNITPNGEKAEWMDHKPENWPQILLMNEFQFGDENFGIGASAFLVVGANDTFACTAHHMLGPEMGISPQIPLSKANDMLDFWWLYPRAETLSSDLLKVDKIVTTEDSPKDIMLMSLKDTAHSIQPLVPRFGRVGFSEKLFLVGCEYEDEGCHQNVFLMKMYSYEEGMLFAEVLEDFDLTGFSGAPVLDKNGSVVGCLVSGGEVDGQYYAGIEPIDGVHKWLK